MTLCFGKNVENAYFLNKEIIILGNFNFDFDFLNANEFSKYRLVKTMRNLHLSQHINQVTRPVSNRCLDHVWTNYPKRIATVDVKRIGLSDHLPTVVVRTFQLAVNHLVRC